MQLYGRGLRRRLPPMLDGDPRRLRMAYSLLFSLPGTPVLFYGEEIGMGENLDVDGPPRRAHADAVDRPAATAASPRARPLATAATGGRGRLRARARQRRRRSATTTESLLVVHRACSIRRYRESPELGWAHFAVLDQPHRHVLAHECSWDDRRLVALHNFSESCTVPLTLEGCDSTDHLVDLLHDEGGAELDDGGPAGSPSRATATGGCG